MNSPIRQHTATLLAILLFGPLCLGSITPGTAAPPIASVPAEKGITAEELNAKIKEIEAAQDVEEGLKGKLIELYRQALRQLERIRSNESAARAFEEARKTAPGETQALRKKLGKSGESIQTVSRVGYCLRTD